MLIRKATQLALETWGSRRCRQTLSIESVPHAIPVTESAVEHHTSQNLADSDLGRLALEHLRRKQLVEMCRRESIEARSCVTIAVVWRMLTTLKFRKSWRAPRVFLTRILPRS